MRFVICKPVAQAHTHTSAIPPFPSPLPCRRSTYADCRHRCPRRLDAKTKGRRARQRERLQTAKKGSECEGLPPRACEERESGKGIDAVLAHQERGVTHTAQRHHRRRCLPPYMFLVMFFLRSIIFPCCRFRFIFLVLRNTLTPTPSRHTQHTSEPTHALAYIHVYIYINKFIYASPLSSSLCVHIYI